GPVRVAEVLVGGDAVADTLLQFLDVGESTLGLPRPEGFAAGAHFEDAAGAGLEGDLAQLLLKGGQELLSHPGGAQEPAALGAIFNFNARRPSHGATPKASGVPPGKCGGRQL